MYKNLVWLQLAADVATEQPEVDSEVVGTEGAAETGTEQAGTEVVETNTEPEPINEFDIDGEKYTKEQLKEFKTGSMRQADYTRKTQEIAEFRKQNADAMELYDFMKANPEVAQQLAEFSRGTNIEHTASKLADPNSSKIDNISIEFATMKINNQLSEICSKDKTVTDMDILSIANSRNVDIDTAYNIWKGQNVDKILKQKLDEQSLSLTDKIKNNKEVTKTLIKSGDTTAPSADFGLSPQQIDMAKKLDMTPEEYAKWNNR